MSQISVNSSPPAPMGALSEPFSRRRFSQSLTRQFLVILAALAALGALCWFDVMMGPHVHLGLFYVLPVLIAAWFGGRWPGYLLSISASVGWFYSGRPASDGSTFLVNGSNLFIRATFYVGVVELLLMLRDFSRGLALSVQERTAQLESEVIERQRAELSLRKLAGQLSAAEDVERRRLAYDIHDALSQMLGLAKMNLETVVAETATDSRQFERLNEVVKTMNDLIRQTREMTFDLHPAMLDDLGLLPTLQRFAEDFQRKTLAEVTINEAGERLGLPNSLASYLFRAIKEVVNNAVKHGNAKEIIIAIHWEPVPSQQTNLRCVVDDDGSGFDPVVALAPQARRGIGLAGIDERLTSLGGHLRVESQPGSGARVVLVVPVPRDIQSHSNGVDAAKRSG